MTRPKDGELKDAFLGQSNNSTSPSHANRQTSKNDVEPLETYCVERSYSKHQMALKAASTAYLISCTPGSGAQAFKPILSPHPDGKGPTCNGPVASTDRNQIIPERGTWTRHNIKRSTVLYPAHRVPTCTPRPLQIFTDTVTPLPCLVRPPFQTRLPEKKDKKERREERNKEKLLSPPSLFPTKRENTPRNNATLQAVAKPAQVKQPEQPE